MERKKQRPAYGPNALVKANTSHSHPNVLVVNPDPAAARLLAGWLEPAGYRVRGVGDGREAIAAIQEEHPQFLVADWDTPAVSGVELCSWLRAQNLPGYVYAIILTARSDPGDRITALESGADDILSKPIEREEILARLRAGSRVLELESHLKLAAKRDPLTGLHTQSAFYELLAKEWSRSDRNGAPLSCVMIDIDYFKRVNDTYGHGVGDEAIRRVARLLEANVRSSDAVSRFGGEEFCVMLPDASERQAVQWAERVRGVLAQTRLSAGEETVQLTASFGAAQRLRETASPEELVDMADQALLVSKNTGRDRVTAWQSLNDSRRAQALAPGASAFQGLSARDVMTPIVVGLNQNEKLGRAVDYFLQLRINSAPVVDDAGRLVGVLSEIDAMAILIRPRWWETAIGEVMKKSVVTYDEEIPVLTIYEFLCRVAIRSVVVVKEGRPTGVISRASLLRWFTNTLVARGEVELERSEPPLHASPQETAGEIASLAQKLVEQAQKLARELQDPRGDLAPRLVGGASRMQELLNDLLGYSRLAQVEGAAGAISLLPSGDPRASPSRLSPPSAQDVPPSAYAFPHLD